jgi:hypothetical protein
MLNLQQDGTIEDLMSPDSPVELQLESLLCWKEILIVSHVPFSMCFVFLTLSSFAAHMQSLFNYSPKPIEWIVEKAKKKMKSKKGLTLSNQISGDLDGEATVLAGVVHEHSSHFYEMMTHNDQRIRLATVELLGVLLSQPVESDGCCKISLCNVGRCTGSQCQSTFAPSFNRRKEKAS